MSIDLDWYVVVSEAQREEVAQRALRQIGVATYVPRHRGFVRRGHKRVSAVRRTYPGYVFIGLQRGSEPWLRISECSAVVGLVGFGTPAVPYRLDAEVVGDIRLREFRGVENEDGSVPARRGAQARLPATYPDERVAGRIGRIVHVISDQRILLMFGGGRSNSEPLFVTGALDEMQLV